MKLCGKWYLSDATWAAGSVGKWTLPENYLSVIPPIGLIFERGWKPLMLFSYGPIIRYGFHKKTIQVNVNRGCDF